MDQSRFLISYVESTKQMCIYTSFAVMLIIIFIMSPLSNIIILSFLGKIAIIVLLGYIIFNNVTKTTHFKNEYNVDFSTTEWGQVKTNIVCGYIFSLFLAFLLFAVLSHLIKPRNNLVQL